MSLRPFLSKIDLHPDAAALAAPDARAFVSQSLRPYVIAALAERDARRPAVVVAGDDRAARDLAADLRAWLRPRPVRFYPSRGVAYESHLSPPAHLVGLRVAALDAVLEQSPGAGGARGRGERRRAEREGPRPRAAAARLHPADRRAARPRRGGDRSRRGRLRARRPGRGPRAVRGPRRPAGRLSGDGGARRSASTCSTTRSSPCAGSRPSRSGRSAMPTASRSRQRRSSPPSTASWPRSRRSSSRTRGPISPSCSPSTTSATCSSCCRRRRR